MEYTVEIVEANSLIVQLGGNSLFVEVNKEGPAGANTTFTYNDIPTGTVDGINRIFTLTYAPIRGIVLSLNGLVQKDGTSFDFVRVGATITFNLGATPQTGDDILATYNY